MGGGMEPCCGLDHGHPQGCRTGPGPTLGRPHGRACGLPGCGEGEIDYFSEVQVYQKAPMQEARERGHQVLGVRWADAEKAVGAHGSRLLANEAKTCNAPELFVSMPSTEPLKQTAQDASTSIMRMNVIWACFYTCASLDICAKLPVDDQKPGEGAHVLEAPGGHVRHCGRAGLAEDLFRDRQVVGT